MGRHSADDGAAVDPVVAAALARRSTGTPSEPGAPRSEGTQGGLGWPGSSTSEDDPASGGGLGWPDGMPTPARQNDDGRRPDGTPARRTRARRWRRLFGARAA